MRWLLIYLLGMIWSMSLAQKKDSVITLPEVTKEASIGMVNYHLIEAYKYSNSKSLNAVLRESAGLYFRDYGNGQLSSVSIRGTSAAQTDVLWNGVKLNSPSLGQVDVSLFNLGMSDEIELGGSARGNVGGYIDMHNAERVDSGISLNASVTYGSFNMLRSFGKVNYGNGRFSGTSRVSSSSCDNDYPIVDLYKPDSRKEKQSNAKVQLLNFMQQFHAKVNERNSIHFNLWLSDANRQIPPIISKATSKEAQDDYSLRSSLSWFGKFKKVSTQYTVAFLHDAIRYRNPEIYLDDKSVMEALRNNFKLTYDSLQKVSVYCEVGYDYERALVPSYVVSRSRHIGKWVAGIKYGPVKQLLLDLALSESVNDKRLSPFAPRVAINYNTRLGKHHRMNLQANVSRTYRFPTLNDLYWVPGGNPSLRTEKGWDGQAGISYRYASYFNLKVNGFSKYIKDWIQWIPNGSDWHPENVKRVLIRGIEVSAKVGGSFYKAASNLNAVLTLNYTYTRATNLDARYAFDQSKGKQLIYVPLHVANAEVYVEFKKVYLRAINTFTDKVFITTDNSQPLKGYYLLDLEAGKDFVIRNLGFGVGFRVNNVADTAYQTVAQRPMPGRSFEGTLRFRFNS
jgi:vitamin B12 transporter